LLKQLFDKLKKAQLFGIKLDETIDISDEGQLILYCRIADEETKPFRVLLVLCERVCATIQYNFAKLNQFIEEHDFDWIKRKPLAANRAAAMQGFSGVVVQKLKRFPSTVFQFMASFIENLYFDITARK